jgi:hypothetical protein
MGRRAPVVLPRILVVLLAACSAPATSAPPGSVTASTSTAPSAPALADRQGLPDLVDGEADPCLPLCVTGLVRPGPLREGTYQTQWFFGGYMTIEMDGTWTGIEDSTGEFKIAPADDPEYGISFALDLYPVADGERVEDVPLTAEGLLSWLRANPRLVVSAESAGSIGPWPAAVVDVSLSDAATPEHDDCPAPCVDFIGFQQWDHANGILGDDVYRFWFADVTYGGTDHLFVVNVEGRDAEHVDQFARLAEELLATVRVPARAP